MSDHGALAAVGELIERRTAPDYVADALRQAILTGVLKEGQELNQVQLAKHFGTSRVPVREALRALQAEGLVRQEAHRRAVVTTLRLDQVMELFDLRGILEPYMLERAMMRFDDEVMARLVDLTEQMDATNDHDHWLELNSEFHHVLYEPSGATYTMDLAERIAARATRSLYLRRGGVGVERNAEANAQHRELLEVVQQKDIHRASQLLKRHIEGTRDRVREAYMERTAEAAAAEAGEANEPSVSEVAAS